MLEGSTERSAAQLTVESVPERHELGLHEVGGLVLGGHAALAQEAVDLVHEDDGRLQLVRQTEHRSHCTATRTVRGPAHAVAVLERASTTGLPLRRPDSIPTELAWLLKAISEMDCGMPDDLVLYPGIRRPF